MAGDSGTAVALSMGRGRHSSIPTGQKKQMHPDQPKPQSTDPMLGEIVADRYLIRGLLVRAGLEPVARAVAAVLEQAGMDVVVD